MEAYGKNFLLKPIKGADTTDSGLYVPGGLGDTKNVCEVVDVGPEVQHGIKRGDKVIFSTGKIFTYKGVEYIACKEDEILVVIS